MEHEETQVLPPAPRDEAWPSPNGDEGRSRSVLDALRAQRRERVAARTLVLEVPGWLGHLGLRLGPIPGRQLDRIVERAESSKSPERTFNANADTLIAACVEVLGREETSQEFITLTDEEGEPLRLDARLAEKLGLEADRARGVVRELYRNANSVEMAVGAAATQYTEWATSANEELDEELLGES
jgi:hypothetical protein